MTANDAHREAHWPCVGACQHTGGACPPPPKPTLADRLAKVLINAMSRRTPK